MLDLVSFSIVTLCAVLFAITFDAFIWRAHRERMVRRSVDRLEKRRMTSVV